MGTETVPSPVVISYTVSPLRFADRDCNAADEYGIDFISILARKEIWSLRPRAAHYFFDLQLLWALFLRRGFASLWPLRKLSCVATGTSHLSPGHKW